MYAVTKNELPYPKVTRQVRLLLSAAEGWFRLGDANEAWLMLQKIPAENVANPAVLLLCWKVHTALDNHNRAIRYANMYVDLYPKSSFGTFCQASSLKSLGKLRDSDEALRRTLLTFEHNLMKQVSAA